MTKHKIDWKIIIAGMFFLTVLEIYALSQGVNGALFTIIIAIIAGTIGYTIPSPKLK